MHACFLKPAEKYKKNVLRVLCEQAESGNFGISKEGS